MANMKMTATASKQGFTLVELIVVITILAILGTIGFISLQGYSAQSRDSKRTSDLRSLSTAVTTKSTEGLSLLSFVTSVAANRLTGITVAGVAPTVATEYEAGTPNATTLGINAGNFKDPSTTTDYRVGATIKAGWAFQFAATLENGTKTALVTGNYNKRLGNTGNGVKALATGTYAIGTDTITLTDAAVGHFKKSDIVAFGGTTPPTGTYTISSVSGDGKTIKFTTNIAGAAAVWGTHTLSLNAAESDGLFSSVSSAGAAQAGTAPTDKSTTALPY